MSKESKRSIDNILKWAGKDLGTLLYLETQLWETVLAEQWRQLPLYKSHRKKEMNNNVEAIGLTTSNILKFLTI